MELIHVDLSAGDLITRPGPLLVPHGVTGLAGVLAEAEEVVVSDRDGEFHAAVVESVDPPAGAAVYVLHVGALLPMDMAAQRLTDVDLGPEHRGHAGVDLLAELPRTPVTRQH
jgi:hypothetical protein